MQFVNYLKTFNMNDIKLRLSWLVRCTFILQVILHLYCVKVLPIPKFY